MSKIKDKWLIAESVDGKREYIIHTAWPVFIAQMADAGDGAVETVGVEWLHEASPDEAANLMRQAGDAWQEYCRRLDEDLTGLQD
jgi:hypothetical protein